MINTNMREKLRPQQKDFFIQTLVIKLGLTTEMEKNSLIRAYSYLFILRSLNNYNFDLF